MKILSVFFVFITLSLSQAYSMESPPQNQLSIKDWSRESFPEQIYRDDFKLRYVYLCTIDNETSHRVILKFQLGLMSACEMPWERKIYSVLLDRGVRHVYVYVSDYFIQILKKFYGYSELEPLAIKLERIWEAEDCLGSKKHNEFFINQFAKKLPEDIVFPNSIVAHGFMDDGLCAELHTNIYHIRMLNLEVRPEIYKKKSFFQLSKPKLSNRSCPTSTVRVCNAEPYLFLADILFKNPRKKDKNKEPTIIYGIDSFVAQKNGFYKHLCIPFGTAKYLLIQDPNSAFAVLPRELIKWIILVGGMMEFRRYGTPHHPFL